MAKAKTIVLKKKRAAAAKKLTQLRARQKKLRADEEALLTQLEAVEEEVPADLEQQIDDLTAQQTDVNDQIGELVDELSNLDEQLDAVAEELDAPADDTSDPADDEEDDGTRAHLGTASRRARTASRPASFRCRSRCFASRGERDAFYARPNVRSFLQRVRALGGSVTNKRGVTGAQLTIPLDILDILRDNLNQYSKLITKVRLRPVSGQARQNIIGKVPEGVWMEMAGVLNNLEFRITDIETDGYKVGGYIPIDNYILADSDLALGEEIMYMLGQAIGYALDKGIVFGLGPNSHMPVGIVTRLAQTAKPGYWGDNQGDWTDLHSSNVLKLLLADKTGETFFVPFLQGCAKIKPTYTADGLIWICNEATKMDLLVRSLAYNSSAAIMAGFDNSMPIIGGEFITLEFMPDKMVVGGYGGEYLLVEREGGTFAVSDQAMFVQDKTVYKGTARYDGQPVSGEAFVALTYDNSDVTTTMAFAPDYANTSANSLVVTSAAGTTSGTTVLTVAGAVNSANKLMAFVGAPAAVSRGDVPDGKWETIVSGTTAIKAPTGSGVTVVELDDAGRVISVGYCASVTAKS